MDMMVSDSTAIDRAFRQRGLSNAAVARELSVSSEAVRAWRTGRNLTGTDYAKRICERWDIPLHEIRPDVWDPPAVTVTPRRKRPA